MKELKDLTENLAKLEAKDKFYAVHGTIVRMLAPQDPKYQRGFTYTKKGWGQIERVESTQDGTPTEKRAPIRRGKTRTGESEVKTGGCWSFNIAKNGLIHKEECVLLPWGTHFGLFKRALFRSLEAQKKLRYESAPLGLIRVYPTWLNVGPAPCESMADKKMPEVILETRHTQRGDVMVEAFFDYVLNRPFECYLEVDSEAPINEEKLVGMLKSLNTLDTIGPAKRGSLEISKVSQVQMEPDDIAKMLKGEAPGPVIY